MNTASERPLRPGDQAPRFSLPAVNRDGRISLDDYRGRIPVLMGLFRGLECPFCRRQLVQLATTAEKLQAMGIETLSIVITPIERARLYFKYRPVRIAVASDSDVTAHRAFGLPRFEVMDDEGALAQWPLGVTREDFRAVRNDAGGELPAPLPLVKVAAELNQRDGFELTKVDEEVRDKHWSQLTGHFLIDRAGIIRWTHGEAERGIADFGRYPGDEEILTAARALTLS